MDTGRIAREMMACSSSHASSCLLQHPMPIGRCQPVLKVVSAIHKVYKALIG